MPKKIGFSLFGVYKKTGNTEKVHNAPSKTWIPGTSQPTNSCPPLGIGVLRC